MDQFGVAILVTTIVFLGVATIFVALRWMSRFFVAHKITLSDYVMLVGWALMCSLSAVIIFATTKGIGLRGGVLPQWKVPLAKAEYVFTVLYVGRPTIFKGMSQVTDQIRVSYINGHQIVYSYLLRHSK
jgi:hypothetical protein